MLLWVFIPIFRLSYSPMLHESGVGVCAYSSLCGTLNYIYITLLMVMLITKLTLEHFPYLCPNVDVILVCTKQPRLDVPNHSHLSECTEDASVCDTGATVCRRRQLECWFVHKQTRLVHYTDKRKGPTAIERETEAAVGPSASPSLAVCTKTCLTKEVAERPPIFVLSQNIEISLP